MIKSLYLGHLFSLCIISSFYEKFGLILFSLLIMLMLSQNGLFFTQTVNGANPSGARDIMRVPLEWCAVLGSPTAALSPDEMDMTLWKRHERATDYIYNPQAQITFRSAIDLFMAGGGNLHFPKINDVSAGGELGEVNPTDRNEINALIHNCREAWANQGTRGFGITAINIDEFIPYTDNMGNTIVIAGTSSCAKQGGELMGPCIRTMQNGNPLYDGFIIVKDNQYTYQVNGRLLDPYDQLVGHELGHALGLWCGSQDCPLPGYVGNHRSDPAALMASPPTLGSGIVDGNVVNNIINNIFLRFDESDLVRRSANNVPGLQIDPPATVINGHVLGAHLVDQIQEADIPEHLDISLASAGLDKFTNETTFGQQLFGLIPNFVKGQQYWILIDTDDNKSTGAKPSMLQTIGVPSTEFTGAEIVAMEEVNNLEVSGTIWSFENGSLVEIPREAYRLHLLTQNLISDPDLVLSNVTMVPMVPLYNTVAFTILNQYPNIGIGRQFNVQALTGQQPVGQPVVLVDRLDESPGEPGIGSSFDNPSFPQCFPMTNATAGGTVEIELVGLLENSPMHGILGDKEVFQGTTNNTGGALIDFPIPETTLPGIRLITIGSDNTALTADCAVNVINGTKVRNQ